jgi:DNA uptake protein ComE-like DNA-binding protein
MEGGLTRQRAYLWLTAALLAVLLAVVMTCHRTPSTPETTTSSDQPQQSEPTQANNSFPTTSHPKQHTAQSNTPTPASAEQPPATIYHKEKQLLFNLNTADSLDLVQLYNIGPTFARRILHYRDLLGGFVDKSQLWEVRGMDSIRYNDIDPHLYADPADITQLDLNSATLDQLKRHPYLDYYQAKAIVQLRDAKGPFNDINDILKIPIIDNQTYTHIAPYLTCNSQPNK